jgi:hypothetical protein
MHESMCPKLLYGDDGGILQQRWKNEGIDSFGSVVGLQLLERKARLGRWAWDVFLVPGQYFVKIKRGGQPPAEQLIGRRAVAFY